MICEFIVCKHALGAACVCFGLAQIHKLCKSEFIVSVPVRIPKVVS